MFAAIAQICDCDNDWKSFGELLKIIYNFYAKNVLLSYKQW